MNQLIVFFVVSIRLFNAVNTNPLEGSEVRHRCLNKRESVPDSHHSVAPEAHHATKSAPTSSIPAIHHQEPANRSSQAAHHEAAVVQAIHHQEPTYNQSERAIHHIYQQVKQGPPAPVPPVVHHQEPTHSNNHSRVAHHETKVEAAVFPVSQQPEAALNENGVKHQVETSTVVHHPEAQQHPDVKHAETQHQHVVKREAKHKVVGNLGTTHHPVTTEKNSRHVATHSPVGNLVAEHHPVTTKKNPHPVTKRTTVVVKGKQPTQKTTKASRRPFRGKREILEHSNIEQHQVGEEDNHHHVAKRCAGVIKFKTLKQQQKTTKASKKPLQAVTSKHRGKREIKVEHHQIGALDHQVAEKNHHHVAKRCVGVAKSKCNKNSISKSKATKASKKPLQVVTSKVRRGKRESEDEGIHTGKN